jgi:hypothetical protein
MTIFFKLHPIIDRPSKTQYSILALMFSLSIDAVQGVYSRVT